ncbi:MAG: hypothetical protein IPP77_06835 [Bacteroidetes bacterium]|nr:hypothetical protein [Bacteroidota bacterium]
MLPTQLVLDLWNKTLDKKVDFTEELVQKLVGDVRFTNPDPTLADVTTAVDAAHQALLDVAKKKGPIQRQWRCKTSAKKHWWRLLPAWEIILKPPAEATKLSSKAST